jgi:hypothetical protein
LPRAGRIDTGVHSVIQHVAAGVVAVVTLVALLAHPAVAQPPTGAEEPPALEPLGAVPDLAGPLAPDSDRERRSIPGRKARDLAWREHLGRELEAAERWRAGFFDGLNGNFDDATKSGATPDQTWPNLRNSLHLRLSVTAIPSLGASDFEQFGRGEIALHLTPWREAVWQSRGLTAQWTRTNPSAWTRALSVIARVGAMQTPGSEELSAERLVLGVKFTQGLEVHQQRWSTSGGDAWWLTVELPAGAYRDQVEPGRDAILTAGFTSRWVGGDGPTVALIRGFGSDGFTGLLVRLRLADVFRASVTWEVRFPDRSWDERESRLELAFGLPTPADTVSFDVAFRIDGDIGYGFSLSGAVRLF